jgi:hypothetical protein
MPRSILVALVASVTWAPAPLIAQAVPGGSLELLASDGTSRTLTPDDLAARPRTEVLVAEESSSSTFEGPALRDLLSEAGAPDGRSLRGPAMSLVVLAEAADGYTVAFTVSELDPQFGDRTAIVAFSRNGQALDPRDGPLQIVLPEDEFHARWVRQLVRLRLVQLAGGGTASGHR